MRVNKENIVLCMSVTAWHYTAVTLRLTTQVTECTNIEALELPGKLVQL